MGISSFHSLIIAVRPEYTWCRVKGEKKSGFFFLFLCFFLHVYIRTESSSDAFNLFQTRVPSTLRGVWEHRLINEINFGFRQVYVGATLLGFLLGAFEQSGATSALPLAPDDRVWSFRFARHRKPDQPWAVSGSLSPGAAPPRHSRFGGHRELWFLGLFEFLRRKNCCTYSPPAQFSEETGRPGKI